MKNLIYILLIFSSLITQAQGTYSISGIIKDEKRQPVSGATVFLANSSKNTVSNAKGEFKLTQLSSGNYDLVIQMLGFDLYSQNIIIQQKSAELQITLKENATALSAVVIKATPDPERPKYLALFKQYFIGHSVNAGLCELLNPDVLRLHYNKENAVLEASADEFLIIENQSLGYRLNYLMTAFKLDLKNSTIYYQGAPYFEELKATASKQKQWEQNRIETYEGSPMHFFRAAFNNTADSEGFLIYNLPDEPALAKLSKKTLSEVHPISSAALLPVVDRDFKEIKTTDLALSDKDASVFYVVYTRKSETPLVTYNRNGTTTTTQITLPIKLPAGPKQISIFKPLLSDIYVGRNGWVSTGGLFFKGYWSRSKIADQLPLDYLSAPADSLILPAEKFRQLLSAIDTFRQVVPQEKVHLQLDKPYYSIGDTIWLKAYVVNADNNELSEQSKVVYVDLIRGQDSIKKTLRLPLISGLAWGDIVLSDTLKEGSYHIRAYTNWMRNFGEEFFFDKQLTIGNALSAGIVAKTAYTFTKELATAVISYSDLSGKVLTGKTVSYEVWQESGKLIIRGRGITDQKGNIKIIFAISPSAPSGSIRTDVDMGEKSPVTKEFSFAGNSSATSVEFFPEGGQLVNEISSRIAFKALGSDGLGKEISGFVTDKDNKRIAEFKSEHAGMGTFMLQPLSANSYKATIRFADGSEKQVELPKAIDQGYALSVSQDSANISIRVIISKDLVQSAEISLVAQHNGVVQYLARKKAGSSTLSATLPQARFPEGILQLTLFSAAGQPVAERLVFIRHSAERLKVNISTEKPVFKQREKVQLDLQVTDQKGIPLEGSFSLAVTDEGKVPYSEENETTIFSNLLLSSDLKGYVEQPNYYFTEINQEKIRQLDNLLLTQGWRRFVWKDVLTSAYPKIVYPADEKLELSGKVTTQRGEPVIGGRVAILLKSGAMRDTITNAEGRFNFGELGLINGTAYNVLAADIKGNKAVLVTLDKTNPQASTLKHPLRESSGLQAYLASSRERFDQMKKHGLLGESIVLEEVSITAKMVKNSMNLNGPGNAVKVLTFLDLLTCRGSLADCLGGRIAGVTIVNGVASARGAPMMVVLDGVPVTEGINGSGLSHIQSQDVQSIEVTKGAAAALYGMDVEGVLIVTTKSGNINYEAYAKEFLNGKEPEPVKKIKDYIARGYDTGREFYSPKYDTPKSITRMADLRTTIYWKPDIITDTNGKAAVEFYNADGTGNYRIIVEGLTPDGKLGRSVYRYIVQQK